MKLKKPPEAVFFIKKNNQNNKTQLKQQLVVYNGYIWLYCYFNGE